VSGTTRPSLSRTLTTRLGDALPNSRPGVSAIALPEEQASDPASGLQVQPWASYSRATPRDSPRGSRTKTESPTT